ncbi:MAG: hypothetical protein H7256_13700 [Bdellovibrio sp.]|nr:hypothetical protein [Bdellovibrio sp.]
MKFISIMLLGLALASISSAAVDDHIRAQAFYLESSEVSFVSESLKPGLFPQFIDHSGHTSGTFNQRYWINSDYATSIDAPVLFHICGEGNAEQGYFLNDNALVWAKALGARVVYLEHRYYGQSLPFADLSSDHMQYLTLDNVLEDMANFQKLISASNGWLGKWISIGGSYSGTLSALYRQRHPELVVGALASSAPMISGIGQSSGTSFDVSYLSSIKPTSTSSARQWAYQACTTFGFWQAMGPGYNSTLQKPSAWLCQQVFGNINLVDNNGYNQNYNLPFISNSPNAPSNILFTYGSNDVWTKIGLATQTNLNTGITIQMISGAGHHEDLNAPTSSDNAQIIAARNTFLVLAKKWLQLKR